MLAVLFKLVCLLASLTGFGWGLLQFLANSMSDGTPPSNLVAYTWMFVGLVMSIIIGIWIFH